MIYLLILDKEYPPITTRPVVMVINNLRSYFTPPGSPRLEISLLKNRKLQSYRVYVSDWLQSVGSGCGSVDRVVATNRGPRFKSSPRQNFMQNLCLLLTLKKTKIKKKKQAGSGPSILFN